MIEFVGLLTTIYLAFTGGVNWGTAAIIFAVMYVFCVQLSLVVIYYDYTQTKMKGFAYLRLIVAALLEPFVYHPLIVFFSLRGYMKFITKQRIVWGEMTRQGFAKKPKQAAS